MPNREGSGREEVVIVDLVVGTDGATHEIELIRSAGNELNQTAVAAVQAWRFDPGTYEGKPVATEIRIRLAFHATSEPTVLMGSTLVSSANQEQVEKLLAAANQAFNRRDYAAAVAGARQLIALVPLAPRIRIVLGMSLLELDQFADAETALKDEIKLEPTSADAYDRLGAIYWRQQKYEEAMAQFQRQISVAPQGYDAHADLGVLLCGRKRCHAAMPELDKALAISPHQSRVLMAHGECNVDLDNTAKGVQEMEEAANESGSSDSWNQAAYRLAERNVELERAQKWAGTAITIASAQLRTLSLEHITPTQMRLAHRIASYWDTQGWIYFRQGHTEEARVYAEAAWRLQPSPTMGSHFGQIYEKLGRQEDALRVYAMAIAAADVPTKAATRPEDQVEAMDRLGTLAGQDANIPETIKRGKADLEAQRLVAIENSPRVSGSADFVMRVAADKVSEVRQISGDAGFAAFAEALRKKDLPVQIPEGLGIEIPRRGTLSCKAEESQCQFSVLRSEEALELATKEAHSALPKTTD